MAKLNPQDYPRLVAVIRKLDTEGHRAQFRTATIYKDNNRAYRFALYSAARRNIGWDTEEFPDDTKDEHINTLLKSIVPTL